MLWNWFRRNDYGGRAQRYREQHSRWLTAALATHWRAPRIPTERVDRGGYGPVMHRPGARAAADAWWGEAFAEIEASGPRGR